MEELEKRVMDLESQLKITRVNIFLFDIFVIF